MIWRITVLCASHTGAQVQPPLQMPFCVACTHMVDHVCQHNTHDDFHAFSSNIKYGIPYSKFKSKFGERVGTPRRGAAESRASDPKHSMVLFFHDETNLSALRTQTLDRPFRATSGAPIAAPSISTFVALLGWATCMTSWRNGRGLRASLRRVRSAHRAHNLMHLGMCILRSRVWQRSEKPRSRISLPVVQGGYAALLKNIREISIKSPHGTRARARRTQVMTQVHNSYESTQASGLAARRSSPRVDATPLPTDIDRP